jgi:hypothetical protein
VAARLAGVLGLVRAAWAASLGLAPPAAPWRGQNDARGPARPTRSSFWVHRPQNDERMKIRAGRAPQRNRPPKPAARVRQWEFRRDA